MPRAPLASASTDHLALRISADELMVACRFRSKSTAAWMSIVKAERAYSLAPSTAGRGAFNSAISSVTEEGRERRLPLLAGSGLQKTPGSCECPSVASVMQINSRVFLQ